MEKLNAHMLINIHKHLYIKLYIKYILFKNNCVQGIAI